jgi:protease I
MPQPSLNGTKVAILVTDDFEEVELTEPRKALEQAGASTKIVAPHSGTVQAMRHDEKPEPIRLT